MGKEQGCMIIDTLFNINFFLALLIGASIGAAAGLIGSLMLTKRMALMGGALGHLALPGVALGLLYGFDISLGAFIFLLVGIFFIWILQKQTALPFEATTAVVFTTFLAIAFLFLPHEETYAALLGDISKITIPLAMINLFLCLAVLVIISFVYKKMVLIYISKDFAQGQGIQVSVYNFIYLLCIALVVALGVRIVGGLMTASLVAIPAATSKNVGKTLGQYRFLSSLFGCLACVLGIFTAIVTKIPVGPSIILCSSLFFVGSLFFKKS